jgi:hypothetical protein
LSIVHVHCLLSMVNLPSSIFQISNSVVSLKSICKLYMSNIQLESLELLNHWNHWNEEIEIERKGQLSDDQNSNECFLQIRHTRSFQVRWIRSKSISCLIRL